MRSPGLEAVLRRLVELLGLSYIRADRVYAAVSFGSSSRSYARIWGLPSPFVRLGVCDPAYVVEVLYEASRGLGCEELLGVLVHELLHIPRSFSGGLRSHGEWSRWSRIRGLVSRIPRGVREELCREAWRALDEARLRTGQG